MQVLVLFAICVILTGMFTYASEYYRADKSVKSQIVDRADKVADEVTMAVMEYPAHDWLLRYWSAHWKDMDIEYDAQYTQDSLTAEKVNLLSEHQPGFNLQYATDYEVNRLPAEDRKLYAEIVYSWIITRIDEIKRIYNIDYLFCVRTSAPYNSQFFVLSAADEGAVRGTEYEQVYTLGVYSEVNESQQDAMQKAIINKSYFADAGNYVDYYSFMKALDGHDYLIGMTFNLAGIMKEIEIQRRYRSIAAMGYQILLSVICSVAILFFVLKPLKTVQENIRQYKDEKNSAKVRKKLELINLNNEIGELASDVIELTEEIDDYLVKMSRITAEKERIGTELELAKQIQFSMLPHIFPPFPDRGEIDLYALMDPAREVGGDFYDYFMTDDDHLCLVIADVSGKGIPAALFMMISRIIIKSCAMLVQSPGEILERANNSICEDNMTDMFVTTWIGILELSTGILRTANAGHEYPAIRHADGDFELIKDAHGFVIGGMEDLKYAEQEILLEPGSAVFVYTDGVPEATDQFGNMFGTKRMLGALNDKPIASPEDIIRHYA